VELARIIVVALACALFGAWSAVKLACNELASVRIRERRASACGFL